MKDPLKKRIPTEVGLNRSDKTRLWISGVLFVMVFGTFLGLRLYGGSGGDEDRGQGRGGFDRMLDKGQRGGGVALPVAQINPAWSSEIGELTFEQASNTDERPFWLILNFARNLGAKGYADVREADGFEIESFAEGAKRMIRIPETYRFKYVALSGRITEMFFDEKPAGNPGEIERVFSAVLEMRDGAVVRLASPHPWESYEAEPTISPLRVEGVFYKKWKYQTPSGRTESAPLVIVTGLFREDD